jgi:aryl-alcohol dehydrogenase-like predicted oxidoreductase
MPPDTHGNEGAPSPIPGVARYPRFGGAGLITEIAAAHGATPAQIALARLLARGPWIIPIPGTRKPHRLEENLGAAAIQLAPGEVRRLDDATATLDIRGARGTGLECYA